MNDTVSEDVKPTDDRLREVLKYCYRPGPAMGAWRCEEIASIVTELLELRAYLAATKPPLAEVTDEPVAWLTEWKFGGEDWVNAHANELTALDEARARNGTITPLYASRRGDVAAWRTDIFEALSNGKLTRLILDAEEVKDPDPDWTPLYRASRPKEEQK
jgi:hypothetical protein